MDWFADEQIAPCLDINTALPSRTDSEHQTKFGRPFISCPRIKMWFIPLWQALERTFL